MYGRYCVMCNMISGLCLLVIRVPLYLHACWSFSSPIVHTARIVCGRVYATIPCPSVRLSVRLSGRLSHVFCGVFAFFYIGSKMLDGNFLPGSLPHKFVLIATSIICFVVPSVL